MLKKRIAVATFFFANGFFYGNWASRIPEILVFFNIGQAAFGSLLAISGVGALVAMPLAGYLTTKYGSKRITQIAGLSVCLIIQFIAIQHNLIVLGVVFIVNSFINGAMDVAMNGQAVYVERLYNKPVMSSFHAIFSIGMVVGALAGGLFSKYGYPLFNQFLIAALMMIGFLIWASNNLVDDKPEPNTSKLEGSAFQMPTAAILPLGIIAFCCMTGEGSMADWSATYMHKIVGKSESFSAIALGVFSAAMTIGRIFGDYFTSILGRRKLLIIDSILSVFGMSIALVFPSEYTVFAGFFLVGLGLSTIVPIVYSTAGNTPGVSPSAGIAMATTIGYSGFFMGPPIIGLLGDAYGLRIGLGFTLILFWVMLFMVNRLLAE
jgi:MFS family permease